LIEEAYRKLASMESAYGLEIQYAMKANPNAAILKLLKNLGAKIDSSSLNEAIRAQKAGFPLHDITYTTQEITEGAER
jgi:diaminopimelate decarboxylase